LTTSPNDHEALTAIRMANKILLNANLGWDKVVTQGSAKSQGGRGGGGAYSDPWGFKAEYKSTDYDPFQDYAKTARGTYNAYQREQAQRQAKEDWDRFQREFHYERSKPPPPKPDIGMMIAAAILKHPGNFWLGQLAAQWQRAKRITKKQTKELQRLYEWTRADDDDESDSDDDTDSADSDARNDFEHDFGSRP